MQVAGRVMLGVVSVVLVAGCRTATRIIEEPRADLELVGAGNRGYLVGTPPPPAERRKTTRQMIETEIEVPPLGIGRPQPPETAAAEEPPAQPPRPTYTK